MSKWFSYISWDEVPHLSQRDKDDLMRSIPVYQRDARTKGIPSLGSGLIYPIDEKVYTVGDFPIPDHYKRAFAMDVGWNWTAALWGAENPDDGVTYIYSAYKRGQAEPETHAKAIKGRGIWIPGVGDAPGVNQKDGTKMMSIYREDYGLDIQMPNKSVEAGIYQVWLKIHDGKLKVFASLQPFFDEIRFYARDDKGKIVKKDDHLMDCMRYLVVSGMGRAIQKPIETQPTEELDHLARFGSGGNLSGNWMGQ